VSLSARAVTLLVGRALALPTGWRFADPWPVVGAAQGLTVRVVLDLLDPADCG
jgi:hypothetical protein